MKREGVKIFGDGVILLVLIIAGFTFGIESAECADFDHRHEAWARLLRESVIVASDGHTSTVRYALIKRNRPQLDSYLRTLSGVKETEFAGWSRGQQLAFLINAYNAFTFDLVLTRYPDLRSIRDIGTFFQTPWKRPFFSLLGATRSLDDIEHGFIRAAGVFDEPRVHVALVCASLGCPMLRPEPFVSDRLGQQLEDSLRRFLSDRQRNRFDSRGRTLHVSKIFEWYRTDFEKGHAGIVSLEALFANHADLLVDDEQGRADIRAGRYRLAFLEYDWRLNDAP